MKFIQIKIKLHNITHVLKKDFGYYLYFNITQILYLNFKDNDINLKLPSAQFAKEFSLLQT